jgi:hypothetical protein
MKCGGCGRTYEPAPPRPNYGEGWSLPTGVCSARCREQVAWLQREQAKLTAAGRPLPDNVVPIGVKR